MNIEKLIKDIKKDIKKGILEDNKEHDHSDEPFDYQSSYVSNFYLIVREKMKLKTHELVDILYILYKIDKLNNIEGLIDKKEYILFNLINEIVLDYDTYHDIQTLFSKGYDGFIYEVLEDKFWKCFFKK